MSEAWASALIGIVFFLTVGGVILLRPIVGRLGEYLEVLVQEKRERGRVREAPDARPAMEGLERRVALLEERLQFAEGMLSAPERADTQAHRADGRARVPGDASRGR